MITFYVKLKIINNRQIYLDCINRYRLLFIIPIYEVLLYINIDYMIHSIKFIEF